MKLTKPTVARLSIPTGKSEALVFDDALPGFGIRLRSGGKRTWIAQYRIGNKQRRVSLGNVEALDVEAARKLAKGVLAKAHLGTDAQIERQTIRTQASVTLGSVAALYVTNYAEKELKPSTVRGVRRTFNVYLAPLSEIPISKLTRAVIASRLGEVSLGSGEPTANLCRAYLSAMFAWAIGKGVADVNPVVGVHKEGEAVSRDRVLTAVELEEVWNAAGSSDYGRIVRLLILTGQRREEVGGMRWSELDLEKAVWTIPAERTKNGRQHDVPLSDAALLLISQVPQREARDNVFGSGAGGFSGWSKSKSLLDARLLNARRELNDKAAPPHPWRLHDLRRTCATGLADLGVMPHVIEAVLNHVSGRKSGVAGVYNRATYVTEKRTALRIWAAHINRFVGAPDV